MAHNLEIVNGKASLFLANSPAWHNLGQVVEGARSWDEVIKIAKMDWTVSKHPLYGKIGDSYVQLPTFGIFRDDNNEFLGNVGAKYTPIQNKYQFEFIDSLLEAEGQSHYESAGVLGKGEKIWAMARIPYGFEVGPTGDKHETYLLFTTSHNGSLAAQARLTTVRVVCWNTLSMAVNMNGNFIKIKHTKDAERRLEASKKIFQGVSQSVYSLKEKFEILGQKMLNKETYVKVLDRLFPVPNGKEDESSTRRNNVMLEITKLFENNDNNTFPEHRGTCFNLLNAITEYTDHMRTVRLTEGRKELTDIQARAETSIFGNGMDLKNNALEILMEESVNCKDRPYATYITRAIQKGEMERDAEIQKTNLLDNILENYEVN